jgi:hypothetical protein
MLVTSLFDPFDPDFVAALNSGEPYGELGEWHAGSGWKEVFRPPGLTTYLSFGPHREN